MQPIVLWDKDHKINPDAHYYSFKSEKGKYRWPTQQGRGLGTCGMWNFLWRLGFHPLLLATEALPEATADAVLFVDKIGAMDKPTIRRLQQWLEQGGKVIATGELNAWKPFLPTGYTWKTTFFDNPHAGTAYLFSDEMPALIAPPQWQFLTYEGHTNEQLFSGQIAAIQGERHTPARASIKPYHNAPAIIQSGSFYYLNAQPFAGFQAWLQGQEDLSPWLAWRHRLFWLDEYVSDLYNHLTRYHVFSTNILRPGLSHLNKTTVILRHDLDYSRDTAFLNEENKRKISATHAVLEDRNTQFWLKQLKAHDHQEIAFHYNTGKRNWKGAIQGLITKKQYMSFLPHHKQIVAMGLLKQIKSAQEKGIQIQTLHRHLSYLIYPEWIDAMDTVFESDLNVLGSSSLFRGHILKWGMDQIDNQYSSVHWPDTPFSLWYPFKLGHAGKNGKILKGWEMTSLMEIEPEMLVQMLDHDITHLSQRIFTLNFHPAHANKSSFYKNGSLAYFKKILDILGEREINIMPMANILRHVNSTVELKYV